MNVFDLRDTLVADYQVFARSFTRIEADDIREQAEYKTSRFWPDPLIQVNPRFEQSATVDELASASRVHAGVARIFRFEEKGNVIPSRRLGEIERRVLGIGEVSLSMPLRDAHQRYFAWHREHVFQL